ncbi:CPBP family intramembrane glutamic endopeptidase [Gorillibacterium sp. CAU 1737]|uniref:CPBP family intramembrane glutamic endopeptidase n=1 Tax=Gorillibacterium sp. CAU 1737 TaxID=3140362 RepID=UPI003261287B
MKKWNFRNVKVKKVSIDDLDDRLLLLNLGITQFLTVLIGIILLVVQEQNLRGLFPIKLPDMVLWGGGLALLVMAADFLVARVADEEVSDDGGINEMLFGKRKIWEIAGISLVVALCEEILFRGGIQFWLGPYWTSILFAAIHVRYLRHWLMTGLVFSISYGLGWVYLHTGTLWTPVIAHFLVDFVMGCLIRYRSNKLDDEEEEEA